jgi:hypothetical protein
VIEDDCLIGMGALVLSGARIGSGSLIGAGALVKEGQAIPPGSLAVGAPARVIGPVNDAHREGIRRGADTYVALSRTYLARGFSQPHPSATSSTGITSRHRGPMSFHEWGGLLVVFAQSVEWVQGRIGRHGEKRFRERPGPERWSALEVLCHLRDVDNDVYLPRLERVLTEEQPVLQALNMDDAESRYREASLRPALDAWISARARLVARLAPLTPREWARMATHSIYGPQMLADMVRSWADHDLSHRRQIAAALGEFA